MERHEVLCTCTSTYKSAPATAEATKEQDNARVNQTGFQIFGVCIASRTFLSHSDLGFVVNSSSAASCTQIRDKAQASTVSRSIRFLAWLWPSFISQTASIITSSTPPPPQHRTLNSASYPFAAEPIERPSEHILDSHGGQRTAIRPLYSLRQHSWGSRPWKRTNSSTSSGKLVPFLCSSGGVTGRYPRFLDGRMMRITRHPRGSLKQKRTRPLLPSYGLRVDNIRHPIVVPVFKEEFADVELSYRLLSSTSLQSTESSIRLHRA
jgi:hypothetical protein